MLNNINSLIIDISDCLNEFSEGNIQYKEAIMKYKNLLNDYQKIVNKNIKHANKGIEGLCYYNNIENYSILSGIYKIENNDIYDLVHYGNIDMNSKIMNSIMGNIKHLKENSMLKIPPNKQNNLSHNIYVYPIIFNNYITKMILLKFDRHYYTNDTKT